jgi:hypothetical protein
MRQQAMLRAVIRMLLLRLKLRSARSQTAAGQQLLDTGVIGGRGGDDLRLPQGGRRGDDRSGRF